MLEIRVVPSEDLVEVALSLRPQAHNPMGIPRSGGAITLQVPAHRRLLVLVPAAQLDLLCLQS